MPRSVRRLHILVVDDDVATHAVVVAALAAIAIIEFVANAAEARSLVAQRGRTFDVAIVGYGADEREASGGALVTALRRLRPQVAVVAMVAGAEGELAAAHAIRQGAAEVLHKPLNAEDLRRAVGRALPARARIYRPPLGVARVLAFLAEHVGQHLSLASLAGIAAMSRSHLSRTFRETVGIPLREYVHDLRLERARHMMLVGRPLTLTEIALESGFYDLPHLDKAFRERFGLTPSEFLRRRRPAVTESRLPRRRPRP